MTTETIFECRSCAMCTPGLTDGTFLCSWGVWRRILGIDGPNAICPLCVGEPDCLDHLIEDGYEHACVEVGS